MVGACSTNGGEDKYIRILVEKSEGKRPLGSLRQRWDYNIKIDFKYDKVPRYLYFFLLFRRIL
jgi:hypothetical protein